MSLTLIFKQHDLHPIQRERLSEAVCHRVLLLLENLSNLKLCKEKILMVGMKRGEERKGGERTEEERAFTTRRSLNRKISR